MANYAMISNGDIKVFNTIVAEPEFIYEGYYFILIDEGVFCQSGMFYNDNDNLFYDDIEFTTINGQPA
ncbi:hypothetical protein [Hafnia psychrotolerans]|uniref:Uncharacterized protein n=1 Tax=Hafnia psychrotolerans TaxID=1477018 RepID=A0ABQ1G1A7_9GAMM|nr:hypothetical protein [Hafnia psychrotolerans]GGA34114.1 hypothetical protein GCM10011328_06210 [Hafnia psychrotolerans]